MKKVFKKILTYVLIGTVSAVLIGFTLNTLMTNSAWVAEKGEIIEYLDWKLLMDPNTYLFGFPCAALAILLYMLLVLL